MRMHNVPMYRCQQELDAANGRNESLQKSVLLLEEQSEHVQEIMRLQREQEQMVEENGAMRAHIDALNMRNGHVVESAEEMAERLDKAVPRARLRWQRSCLRVRAGRLRELLHDSELELDEARAETERVGVRAERSITLARDEVDSYRTMLSEEKSRTEVLTTALAQASDAVASLQAKQGSLILTAKEAAFKTRQLEGHVARNEGKSDDAASLLETTKQQLHHARWELQMAAESESALREQLHQEEIGHSNTTRALEALRAERPPTGGELRQRAKGATAEAAAATAAALALSEQSLREAAAARSDRSRLEARLRQLERDSRERTSAAKHALPGSGVRLLVKHSASSPRLPSRLSPVGSAGGQPPPRSANVKENPAGLPVSALHAQILDLIHTPTSSGGGSGASPIGRRRSPRMSPPHRPGTVPALKSPPSRLAGGTRDVLNMAPAVAQPPALNMARGGSASGAMAPMAPPPSRGS